MLSGVIHELILQLLRDRDESRESARYGNQSEDRAAALEEQILSLKYLFYNRGDISLQTNPILIGPINNESKTLSIAISWKNILKESFNSSGQQSLSFSDQDDSSLLSLSPFFEIKIGSRHYTEPVDNYLRRTYSSSVDNSSSTLISSMGLTRVQVSRLWDKIALTNLENEVLSALRIISSNIERLSLIGDQSTNRHRIPVVKVAGIDHPLPLRSLGDGMNRLLGIALGLVTTHNGVLLIDELENGLHYSVQTDVWRIIFSLAHRLNVQVFVTTHSWDCIQSFQRAAEEFGENSAMLVRLGQKHTKTVATIYEQQELSVVTKEHVEVR